MENVDDSFCGYDVSLPLYEGHDDKRSWAPSNNTCALEL